MTPQAQKFIEILQRLPVLSPSRRAAAWADVGQLLSIVLLQNRGAIGKRPELAGKMARVNKLFSTIKTAGYKDTELDAAYLALLRQADTVLAGVGFFSSDDKYTQDTLDGVRAGGLSDLIGKRDRNWHEVSAHKYAELQVMLTTIATRMLKQFKVTIEVDRDDGELMVWDGQAKRLRLGLERAAAIRENISKFGAYETVAGQLVPLMMTTQYPLLSSMEFGAWVAMVGVGLGAQSNTVLSGTPPKPDMYRGDAQRLFNAMWEEPMSIEDMRRDFPNLDVRRVLGMFRADAHDTKQFVYGKSGGGHLYYVATA